MYCKAYPCQLLQPAVDAFDPRSGGISSAFRNIGVALAQQQTVEVSATFAGATDFNYCVGVQPIPTSMVPSTEQQADFFNFVVGCGSTGPIAPGAKQLCFGAAGSLRSSW